MANERVPSGLDSVSTWVRLQRDLLRLERDEEKAQLVDTIAQLPAQVCLLRFEGRRLALCKVSLPNS